MAQDLVVRVSTATLVAGCAIFYGGTGAAALASASRDVRAASLLLGCTLAALTIIDARTLRLPDGLTLPLLVCGLAVVAWLDVGDPAWHAVAAAAAFAVLVAIAAAFRQVRGVEALGLGDAKLFAAAGAWLGFGGLADVLLWASLTALAAVIVASVAGYGIGRDTRLPFGPFLAGAFWIAWLTR